MRSVESSTIDAVGYDAVTKRLTVKFKSGGTYHYEGVTADKHAAMLKAKSIGSYFHQHVKPHHKHSKVRV